MPTRTPIQPARTDAWPKCRTKAAFGNFPLTPNVENNAMATTNKTAGMSKSISGVDTVITAPTTIAVDPRTPIATPIISNSIDAMIAVTRKPSGHLPKFN